MRSAFKKPRHVLGSRPQPKIARKLFRLSVELLEERVVLAGENVAIIVAGLGGQFTPYIPRDVEAVLESRGFEISYSNWNDFDDPADLLGVDSNAGSAAPAIGSSIQFGPFGIPGLGSVGPFSIPTFLSFDIDIGNPNTRDNFLAEATAYLRNFDDDDNIVLIGHSLGGGAALELARQVSVNIDLLALLDPVGFTATLPPNTDDVILFEINAALLANTGGVLAVSAPSGLQNDDDQAPGFRSSGAFGGGLPSAPANVSYLYNRWQTNGPFPLDFPLSGRIGSGAQVSDQRSQNTGADFGLNDISGDPALALAYVTDNFEHDPFTYSEECIPLTDICRTIPTGFNSRLTRSNAQLHHNFPQNSTIQQELINLLQAILPQVVHGTDGDDRILVSAGNNSEEVRIIVNDNDLGSIPVQKGQIHIDAGQGNDQLIVDLGGGTLNGQTLIFTGGGGFDTLETRNGVFGAGTIAVNGRTSGSIKLDSVTIAFDEVNRIIAVSPVTEMRFLTTGQAETINIVDGDSHFGQFTTQVNSGATGRFITTDVANVANFTVAAQAGNDQITLDNPTPAAGLATLTVDAGSGDDTLFVLATAVDIVTTLEDAFSDINTLNVVHVGDHDSLSRIRGILNVEASSSFVDLRLSDSASTAGRSIVLNASSVVGIAPAPINFVADDVKVLTIRGGSGGNVFTIEDTPSSRFTSTIMHLFSGEGIDLVNVRGTTGLLMLQTGQGDDVVSISSNAGINNEGQLGAILGPMTVDVGSGDRNRMVVSDFGGGGNANVIVTQDRITGFAPATIRYRATGGHFAGTASDGILLIGSDLEADSFQVVSTLGGSTTAIDGSDGDDTFMVGNAVDSLDDILGPLTIHGGDSTGADSLILNDQGDDSSNVYVVTGTTMERTGIPIIVYRSIESLLLQAGTGNDIVQVLSTSATQTVGVSGGIGADDFIVATGNLDTIAGRLTISGGPGDKDSVFLDDGGNALFADYVVTPSSLEGKMSPLAPPSGPTRTFAGVDYDGTSEFLRLHGTDASNVFDVQPSLNTRYYIDGNLPGPGSACAVNGDFLKLDTTGTTGRHLDIFERGRGQWTFTSDHQPVEFESIERFNHVDIVAVGPDDGFDSHPLVKVYDAETREFKFEFYAYGLDHRNGVRVATGDVDEDGLPDIVTAAGRLHAPEIRVFNGTSQGGLTASELARLRIRADQTFGASFINGMQLAVGDVTGDGCRDIMAVPTRGRATVKVFENRLGGSLTETRSFDAFGDLPQFIGGATVAIADTDGASDGNTRGDIIVASGPGMAGRIRVFDVSAPASAYAAIREISDPNAGFNGGLNVAVGDVNGDQIADILTGAGPGGLSVVHVYDGRMGSSNQPLNSFRAFVDESSNSSVRVAARDVDDDGNAEIFVVQGSDGRNGYQIKVFDALNASPVNPDPGTPGTVTSSSALVRQLYLDVLGREPEPGAWQYWAGQLDFGQATPDQIATGILESDERMDPVIRQMYRDYLFREAEPGGLAYWRGIWREHGSPDEVTAGIVSSLEFYQSAGATNQLWVAELYRRLLGRDADGNGLAYWSQSLDSGQFERDEVVGGFTDSAENARNLVRSWFTQYLDRAAAEGEVDTYAHLLLNGRSQRAVQLDLVTSQEYGRLAVQSIAGQSDLVDAFFANAQDFTGGGLFLG